MSEKRSSKGGEIPQMHNLDAIDRKIIAALHQNSRISYTDLGAQIGLSRVAVQARINALSEKGIIERFTVVINPGKVGLQVSAFFNVDVEPLFLDEVAAKLDEEPAVTSLYHMTGPSTLHMHGIFADMEEMEQFLLEKLYKMPGIVKVESQLLLKRYKSRMGMRLQEDISMSWKDYNGLVIGMVRTGILGYGGGPSVIPLIRYEAVTRYKWVSDDEFGEILAIANALPGPIATKMAAYLGYKTKGVLGAIVSVLAHILPTSIAIIALLGSMYALRESKIVAGMVAAVRPVIFVMLGMMAYEFAKKAWKGLGTTFAALFGVLAFVLLQLLDIHPGIVIAVFLGYGVFHLDVVQRFKSKGNSDKGVS